MNIDDEVDYNMFGWLSNSINYKNYNAVLIFYYLHININLLCIQWMKTNKKKKKNKKIIFLWWWLKWMIIVIFNQWTILTTFIQKK